MYHPSWILLLSILLSSLLVAVSAELTASFYGASFISVPLQDASSTTDIYLRFKTHRREGLLLLAAGPTDYCALLLQDGEVRLRLNLGSGEVALTSAPGLRLDDLLWHEVEVHRSETELSLTLDGIHSTYLDIPGRFSELNIKLGLFVGGLSPAFNELYLGHLDSFRGCIGDVTFNDQEVLKMATESSDPRSVYGITWECSSEFEASSFQPISFVERNAFVALPSWNARNGGAVTFDLKTQSTSAVLFYNAGSPSKSDFVALEVINGKVVLSVNEGNGVSSLQSDAVISDGFWHRIQAQFGPSYLEISTDDQVKNLRQGGGPGENRFFDLTGYLYLGGVELNRQTRALQHGLQSVGSELRGCIRNLKINSEVAGLREAEITQGVRSDCVWQYPCLENPCLEDGECFQEGLNSFRCLCEGTESCVRTNYSGSGYKLYASSLPVDLEVLALQPLELDEGSGRLLTLEHIRVTIDYARYGVRDSGVVFRVIESPRHGTLEVELWRAGSEGDGIFTLMDLTTEKVRYSHDGSETDGDSMTLELEFRVRNFRLPAFLEQRHRFVFHIRVNPVNDPPQLRPVKALRLARGSKRALTSDFLQAEDPDTIPEHLIYSVISLGGKEESFVEHSKRPGEPVQNFTQEEVNRKVIYYVQKGSAETERLALRLSDGPNEDGPTAVLSVTVFDLTLTAHRNTGLAIPLLTHAIISAQNLTFVANTATEQPLEIRYEVIRPPAHGILQKLRPDATWQTGITHFTQRQLARNKVRYVHTGGGDRDSFQFEVFCSELRLPTRHDFYFTLGSITLEQVGSSELLLETGVEETALTVICYRSLPLGTPAEQIFYTLSTLPTHGSILLRSQPSERHHRRLEAGSTWTQRDLNEGHLHYRLQQRRAPSDEFTFTLKASDKELVGQRFKIRHFPLTTGDLTNEKLVVVEGETGIIGIGQLYVEVPDTVEVIFNITEPPRHGHLLIEENPCWTFNNDDLLRGRLTYAHDGSEHEQDQFVFVATSPQKPDLIHQGIFRVSVLLKNDNPPVRVVDKTFFVVQGGERKLTGRDICYRDDDIDSKPSDIQYTRRGIPNGALFHIDNSQIQVFQFTQEDLDQERIVFRHTGADHGQAVLWVTDGQFYATGLLDIRASSSFLNVTVNTGLVVQRGNAVALTAANLSVETNLDADEVRFKIVSGPKRGDLLLNGLSANQFSQSQLQEGSRLIYQNHQDDDSATDSFRFVAFVADTTTPEQVFEFRIFPADYWKPLKVVSNRTLKVDQGQRATIDASIIHVMGINVSYVVRENPRNGRLLLEGKQEVKTFCQTDINERRLVYEQTERSVYKDVFVVDASNGVSSLRDLFVLVDVVSKMVHLRTGNLTVPEGQSVSLFEAISIPLEWAGEILVVERPKNGALQNTDGAEIKTFTPVQLHRNEVLYRHDNSETTRDWFTVVARAESTRRRESAPGTVHVAVLPVNDEAPHLVNNTGLEMWEGSVATIGGGHLAAADDDSEASDLTFVLSSSNNGYVAFRNDTTTPVLSFTQENINDGEVVYLHTGERTGGFRFQVNDGVNYGSPHIFTVMARPLKMLITVNQKLYVFPRMQQSITKDHLQVGTNDPEGRRQIVFHVTRPPSHGRILLESPDGSLNPVTQFTQDQINKNLVLYEALADVAAVDTVTFDLETPHAEIMRNVKFHVVISIGSEEGAGSLRDVIHLRSLEVEEGGVVSVGPKHINISRLVELWQEKGKGQFAERLRMRVLRLPSHGWLELEGRNISSATWFGQKEIRQRMVHLHHDGSDTQRDSFVVAFHLDEVLFFNGSIPIIIFPVNDQPFVLQNQSPHLEVIQGRWAIITSLQLNTTDADDVPGDIVYELVSTPTAGFVVRNETPVTTFTQRRGPIEMLQEDIDEGTIRFQHDGSSTLLSGGFHFKVSDGHHKATYAVLTVHLLPLTLSVAEARALKLEQGSAAVFLQPRHLGVQTNGDRHKLQYNLTSSPSHGQLRVQDQPAETFQERHLESDAVVYVQLNFSASEDSFQLTVSDGTQDAQVEVRVIVVPLVTQNPCNTTSGENLVLSLAHLDASPLAKKTKSNPVYRVTRQPLFATVLVKVNRSQRTSSSDLSFSHEDVRSGRVILVSASLLNHSQPLVDSFHYVVTAPHVQPARGSFTFTLFPRDLEDEGGVHRVFNGSWLPSSPVPDVFHPSISRDDFLVVAVTCAAVLLVAVIIVIAIRCRVAMSRKKKRGRDDITADGKFPGSGTDLSGDCLPSSDELSDELPPPVPPTSPSSTGSGPPTLPPPYVTTEVGLPTCKVTPLEQDGKGLFVDGSDKWNHLEEDEAMHFGPPVNPLLGKNQYWV